MAIEDPPPVSVKPLSGTPPWANFGENTPDLDWSTTCTYSCGHQDTDWATRDSQGVSDWHDLYHTDSKTEWQDFAHTEAKEGDCSRDSMTEWQDFDNTDSKHVWQDFSQTVDLETRTKTSNSHGSLLPSPVASYTGRSYKVFGECFHSTCTCSDRLSLTFQPLNTCRQWSELVDKSLSLVPPPSVFGQTLNNILSLSDPNTSKDSLQLNLPADDDSFEWSRSSSPPLVSPSYFRPEKPESPVDINFDHSRAALGLASLSESELQEMHTEMKEKFTKLSEVLIDELQHRDMMASQLDTKNNFIAALLRVQTLKHLSSVATADPVKSLRSRARSLSSSMRQGSEEKPLGKFLHSVVPYHMPEDGKWKISMLRQLTNILRAIAEDSEAVPGLVAAYIQSEIFVTSEEEIVRT